MHVSADLGAQTGADASQPRGPLAPTCIQHMGTLPRFPSSSGRSPELSGRCVRGSRPCAPRPSSPSSRCGPSGCPGRGSRAPGSCSSRLPAAPGATAHKSHDISQVFTRLQCVAYQYFLRCVSERGRSERERRASSHVPLQSSRFNREKTAKSRRAHDCSGVARARYALARSRIAKKSRNFD